MPDKKKQDYYEKNKAARLAYQNEYYKKNRDKVREYQKKRTESLLAPEKS